MKEEKPTATSIPASLEAALLKTEKVNVHNSLSLVHISNFIQTIKLIKFNLGYCNKNNNSEDRKECQVQGGACCCNNYDPGWKSGQQFSEETHNLLFVIQPMQQLGKELKELIEKHQ